MSQAPAYPIGRAYSESRIATQDGYLWPFPRHQMVAPGAILERMVEDIAALVRQDGEDAVVSLQHLGSLGWLPAQVEAHGARAFARHNGQADNPLPGARAARFAAEAACLLCFLSGLGILTGALTGVL